jgi:hypothetical protein
LAPKTVFTAELFSRIVFARLREGKNYAILTSILRHVQNKTLDTVHCDAGSGSNKKNNAAPGGSGSVTLICSIIYKFFTIGLSFLLG